MGEQVEKYNTIADPAEGFYKEKGSRFIAFSFPVKNIEEVKDHLGELRKKYYDARHHCYAYVIGAERTDVRANDDGEPNHSAGDPILGQINSYELTNVLVVVVRYFGGTKLGVGGLIHAYRTAAHEALQASKVIEVEITHLIEVNYGYEDTNEVMRLISEHELKVIEQEFKESCYLKAAVKIGFLTALDSKVELLNETGHEISLQHLD